ncbi:GNAT family N-acetyltransferase [Hoyosella sp. YIM 151337]|uniref:GNAT family N-acetyltransferase n=1 Tax=Hoyosella sp. YIM 151337 TaxID=2992742 RepID=UPI002236B72A|nr:GNAT family N-acyltransferase [Hoyosella sp. YIM 151337]MCW4354589.1 GNAT family N-acetyltransferase [Hoyosella sp. YIM 151337]
MTTSSVLIPAPAVPVDKADASLAAPRYSLLLSTDRSDVRAVQELRYDVFRSEPGFSDSIGEDGRDADRFDDYCDHLLVREDASGAIIGCYRMLPPTAAAAAGGYYTATEFALSGFGTILSSTVEMGRACVHPDHRNGAVLSLMWSGILHYLTLTGNEWVLGCVSVPIRTHPDETPGANARGVRDALHARYRCPAPMDARPLRPVILDGKSLDEIEPPQRADIPPLLRGYLRLGARVCGEPAYDPDFGVADFVAVLGVRQANARYLERLRAATLHVPVLAG